ncbi:MAG: ferrous iron transport protein A [Ruminococcus sp.]
MMPLTFANVGEENCIRKIGGNPETKKFLENLGYCRWWTLIVVNEINETLIVNVKESECSSFKEMANKILV